MMADSTIFSISNQIGNKHRIYCRRSWGEKNVSKCPYFLLTPLLKAIKSGYPKLIPASIWKELSGLEDDSGPRPFKLIRLGLKIINFFQKIGVGEFFLSNMTDIRCFGNAYRGIMGSITLYSTFCASCLASRLLDHMH